jgi:DivIVA domain-containing protein
MALDRGEIERRDFPTGRRGYDPKAVDAHLSGLADEVERLREAADRPPKEPTAGAAASDRVRSIVEAAERSAHEIEAAARDDAQRTRGEADADSREQVERVSAASGSLLDRVEALDHELSGLVERLRDGATRLQADLEALEDELGELRSATGVAAPADPDGEPATPGRAAPDRAAPGRSASGRSAPDRSAPAVSEPPVSEPAASRPAPAEPASAGDARPASPAGDESEGARLVALNMALSGTPRDETERYLEANFTLDDRAGLLDDVYARVEA